MKIAETKTFKEICDEKRSAKADFIKLLQTVTDANIATVYRWINGVQVPAARDRKKIAEALCSTTETLFGL